MIENQLSPRCSNTNDIAEFFSYQFLFFHYNLFLFSFSFFFHRGYIISVKKQFKITRPFQKWNASVYIYLYSHASKKVPRVQYNIYIYKSKKKFSLFISLTIKHCYYPHRRISIIFLSAPLWYVRKNRRNYLSRFPSIICFSISLFSFRLVAHQ